MSDCDKLVEALRYCGNFTEREGCAESCEYFNDIDCPNRIMSDAAAAIEELLPKRGQWELIDGAEPMRWGCSRCKYLSWETSNYCPRCGAKMNGEQNVE